MRRKRIHFAQTVPPHAEVCDQRRIGGRPLVLGAQSAQIKLALESTPEPLLCDFRGMAIGSRAEC